MAELSHLDLTMKYLDRSVFIFLNSDHPILASCLNPNQFAWNFQSCYFFHHHGMNTPLMGMPPAKCYPSTCEWMYFFPDVSWQSHLHFTWSPPKPPWSTFGCIFLLFSKPYSYQYLGRSIASKKVSKKKNVFFSRWGSSPCSRVTQVVCTSSWEENLRHTINVLIAIIIIKRK